MPIVWDTSRVRVFEHEGRSPRYDVYQRVAPRDGNWSLRLSGTDKAAAIADAQAYDASLVNAADERRIYESKVDPAETYTRVPPHSKDADCTVEEKVCTTRSCGAYHGDPCGDCQQRAFHSDRCRQMVGDAAVVADSAAGAR